MSKSKQQSNRATEALRRRGQSLPLKPLDIEQRFIDDLMSLRLGTRNSLPPPAQLVAQHVEIVSVHRLNEIKSGLALTNDYSIVNL
jgi:hypothetical protein